MTWVEGHGRRLSPAVPAGTSGAPLGAQARVWGFPGARVSLVRLAPLAALALLACPGPSAGPAPDGVGDSDEVAVRDTAPPAEVGSSASEADTGRPLPGPGVAEVLVHLAGCWRAEGPPDDTWLVHYTLPMDGVVLGTTRQIRGGRLLRDEVERFAPDEEGRLAVVVTAAGIPRARYRLLPERSRPGDATFRREGQGAPEQITYRRNDQGQLELIARTGEQAVGLRLAPTDCR